MEDAESGWNLLGSFYYSADTAKVELSNKNTGRRVFADAVRWVGEGTKTEPSKKNKKQNAEAKKNKKSKVKPQ